MKNKKDKLKLGSIFFGYINPILVLINTITLILFVGSFFFADSIYELLKTDSIYFYPVLSSLLVFTSFLKVFLILTRYMIKGEYLEDFLIFIFLAGLILNINISSVLENSDLIQIIAQSTLSPLDILFQTIIPNFIESIRTLLLTLTLQYPTLKNLGFNESFVTYQTILQYIISLSILSSLSYLTISFFISNLLLKIKMNLRKYYRDRYLIFTDQPVEKILNFVGEIKKKNYVKVFIFEQNDYTKSGQDYRKILEANDLNVVSINLTNQSLKGIFLSHFNRNIFTKQKNLFVSYYIDDQNNRKFSDAFNKVLENYNKLFLNLSVKFSGFINNVMKKAFSNIDGLNDTFNVTEKNGIIKGFLPISNLSQYYKIVAFSNQKNQFINFQYQKNSNIFVNSINYSYISAYLFVHDFLNETISSLRTSDFKTVNLVLIGQGPFNYFLRDLFHSIIIPNIEIKVHSFEQNSKNKFNSNLNTQLFNEKLNEDRYLVNGNILEKKLDEIIIDDGLDFKNNNQLNLLFLDHKSEYYNTSISTYLSSRIREYNNNLKENNSMFLLYSNSLISDISITYDLKKISKIISEWSKKKENEIDEFAPIQSIIAKSQLYDIYRFYFEIEKEIKINLVTDKFNNIPIDYFSNNKTSFDEINKIDTELVWQSLYYLIFNKPLDNSQKKTLNRFSLDPLASVTNSAIISQAKNFILKFKDNVKNNIDSTIDSTILSTLLKDIAFSEEFLNLTKNESKHKKGFTFLNLFNHSKSDNLLNIYGTISLIDSQRNDILYLYYFYEKNIFVNILRSYVKEDILKKGDNIVIGLPQLDDIKIEKIREFYSIWEKSFLNKDPWNYSINNEYNHNVLKVAKTYFKKDLSSENTEEGNATEEAYENLSSYLENLTIIDTKTRKFNNLSNNSFKAILYSNHKKFFDQNYQETSFEGFVIILNLMGRFIYPITHYELFKLLIK